MSIGGSITAYCWFLTLNWTEAVHVCCLGSKHSHPRQRLLCIFIFWARKKKHEAEVKIDCKPPTLTGWHKGPWVIYGVGFDPCSWNILVLNCQLTVWLWTNTLYEYITDVLKLYGRQDIRAEVLVILYCTEI